MYVARILYPVKVLGPGDRIGIWLCGCKHKCKGCSNPELWECDDKYKTTVDNVLELINNIVANNHVDGFTITGGEPMFQYDELMILISKLKIISDDIIVYTGYTKEELDRKNLEGIAVLIDGKYIEELNDDTFLRGSSNQKVYILNEKYRRFYDEYLESGKNQIQNFTLKDGTISVGIHRADF